MLAKHAAIALLLTSALAGCGSDSDGSKGSKADDFSDKSAVDIAKASQDAMAKATSLRFAGTVTDDGQKITLDMHLNTDAECAGTVGMEGQGEAEFIDGPEGLFLKGTEEFWRANGGAQADTIITLLGDKWAKLPSGSDGPFQEFCDLDQLIDKFGEDDPADDEHLEKGPVEDVDGEEAVRLDSEDAKIWIATGTPHYMLKFQDDEADVEFSEYDQKVDAAAPPEDEVLDLAKAAG